MKSGREQKTMGYILGDQLETNERRDLHLLFRRYPAVMSRRCGCTLVIKHHINVTSGQPVRQQPYRLPHAYRDTVETQLKEILAEGIIEPASGEWASPMVLVRKKDNTIRICIDYRRLNAMTQIDAYPIPTFTYKSEQY